MFRSLKDFFKKLECGMLFRKLIRLSSEAYSLNFKIQSSDLPDTVKERSNKVFEAYVAYMGSCSLERK